VLAKHFGTIILLSQLTACPMALRERLAFASQAGQYARTHPNTRKHLQGAHTWPHILDLDLGVFGSCSLSVTILQTLISTRTKVQIRLAGQNESLGLDRLHSRVEVAIVRFLL
jgi:hypothetical protein